MNTEHPVAYRCCPAFLCHCFRPERALARSAVGLQLPCVGLVGWIRARGIYGQRGARVRRGRRGVNTAIGFTPEARGRSGCCHLRQVPCVARAFHDGPSLVWLRIRNGPALIVLVLMARALHTLTGALLLLPLARSFRGLAGTRSLRQRLLAGNQDDRRQPPSLECIQSILDISHLHSSYGPRENLSFSAYVMRPRARNYRGDLPRRTCGLRMYRRQTGHGVV